MTEQADLIQAAFSAPIILLQFQLLSKINTLETKLAEIATKVIKLELRDEREKE